MKILYVEDNKVNLMLVERVARMDGHEVINRTTGEATLEEFDAIAPEIVLMDIQLEGAMTGLEAVRILRERGVDIPIIAVTAYAMKGDREKALNAGCDEYIPKPIPVKILLQLLHKYSKPSTEKKRPDSDKTVATTDIAASDNAPTPNNSEPTPNENTKVEQPEASAPTGPSNNETPAAPAETVSHQHPKPEPETEQHSNGTSQNTTEA